MLDKLMDRVSPEPNSGCWLWTGRVSSKGYGELHVGRQKYARAHRLSYETHCGPIPDGLFVCHKCDVPSCVNPDHLWLGSHLENMRDCKAKRRNVAGEKNGRSKLSAETVGRIRAADGTIQSIADRFAVSIGTVSMIKSRKTWKHV